MRTIEEDHQNLLDRLRAAIESGESIDLSPESQRLPPSRRAEYSLSADSIREALLDQQVRPDPQGLTIKGAYITGFLNLDYASLPCRLFISNCHFDFPPSFKHAALPSLVLRHTALPGLFLDGATVTHDVVLTGLRAKGRVSLSGAQLGSRLGLRKAKLSNHDGCALVLDRATIGSNADLEELQVEGEVRALNATIGGQLNLKKAVLKNPGSSSLNLTRATVMGNATLNELHSEGEIRALSTKFGGQLAMIRAVLKNPGGNSLNLTRATVMGNATLNELHSEGEIRGLSTKINGQLVMTKAILMNSGGNTANLTRATIIGNANLNELSADGAVQAVNAYIGGQLILENAALENPGEDALVLDGTGITKDANLSELHAEGGVRAVGTTFGGRLILEQAQFTNPGGVALNLESSTVENLALGGGIFTEGPIDLSFASIHVLDVGIRREEPLPPLAGAYGWSVQMLSGFVRTDVAAASKWLDTIDAGRKEFSSQPWKELANLYAEIGQPEDARRLRWSAARRTTRAMPWPSKMLRWPYGALVGYGYYPLIVVGWLALLWAAAWALCSSQSDAFTPTSTDFATMEMTTNNQTITTHVTGAIEGLEGYPRFSPVLFAVDTALPAAATGQEDAWRITESTWLSGSFAAIKGLGWILTALLLAGITGILRKD